MVGVQKGEIEMSNNFCSQCGAALEQDAKFCGSCGAKVESVVQMQAQSVQKDSQGQLRQEFDTVKKNVAGQFETVGRGKWQQKVEGNSFFQRFKAEYFTTQGRLNRRAYIFISIKLFFMSLIPYLLLGISVSLMSAGSESANLLGLFLILPSFALIVPFVVASFMVGARRCHDLGHSGWMVFLTVIPYVNIIFGLYILFFRGTVGANQYGEDPLQMPVY